MAELETEVELLKKEVSDMKLIHGRLDEAIIKITDVSNSIHRMLAVHEEKLNQQEEAVYAAEELIEQRRTEFQNELKELHSRITTNTKEINPGWAHRTERASIPVEALIEVPEGFRWPKEKAMVTGQIINGGK